MSRNLARYALDAAWRWFVRSKGPISVSDIITRVHVHRPEIPPERIRQEIENRLCAGMWPRGATVEERESVRKLVAGH